MKEKYNDIHILLERFFEGQTTNKEEQKLFRFFEKEDIPEEFIRYKPVINYFKSGLADELKSAHLPPIIPLHSQEGDRIPTPSYPARKYWIRWTGIAASILFMLFSSLYVLRETDPYEGSYIIRNGVRITDLKLIRSDLIATEQKVLSQLREAEQIFMQSFELDDNFDNQIMQILDEHNHRIIENF